MRPLLSQRAVSLHILFPFYVSAMQSRVGLHFASYVWPSLVPIVVLEEGQYKESYAMELSVDVLAHYLHTRTEIN